jgi:quercetin dioxygenase-like cupin family protein
MQRILFILLTCILAISANAQKIETHHINPDSSDYPNVYVKQVAEDSLQSTYIIWVKNSVQAHYHSDHTEIVEILSGKGRMTLNGETFIVHKHDIIVIPKGSVHSVKNLHHRPLKVLSIQAPKFDGDRIWVGTDKST